METTVMENQMEKKMENEMETGIIVIPLYSPYITPISPLKRSEEAQLHSDRSPLSTKLGFESQKPGRQKPLSFKV